MNVGVYGGPDTIGCVIGKPESEEAMELNAWVGDSFIQVRFFFFIFDFIIFFIFLFSFLEDDSMESRGKT